MSVGTGMEFNATSSAAGKTSVKIDMSETNFCSWCEVLQKACFLSDAIWPKIQTDEGHASI